MISTDLEDFEISIDKVATAAARKAGDAILAGSGTISLRNDIYSKIGSRDIVTEVDKTCQAMIKDTIIAAFPHHSFLGEEDIDPGIEASVHAVERYKDVPHLWIVDPIDGTTNFAHGMPLSGVIIAYASYGITQYGAIFDPFRNELFTAWLGKGAYLNGTPIRCCGTSNLSGSVIATGSPPNLRALAACLRATQQISHKVRTVRMLGSAAVMLSWVAMGRLTAYCEADLNVWDLAAGALMIREAGQCLFMYEICIAALYESPLILYPSCNTGGNVTDVWGREYSLTTRNLVASNGLIHRDLLHELVLAEMWIEE